MLINILIIVIILIVLGVIGKIASNLKMTVSQVIKGVITIVGIAVFIWFITTLYDSQNTPDKKLKRSIGNTSTLVINCDSNTLYRISTENGIQKTHSVISITDDIDVDFLNNFQYVIINNPPNGEFITDTFKKNEIEFISSSQFINGHNCDHIQYWRNIETADNNINIE